MTREVLEGEVVAGKHLGRTIGFPTANLRLTHPPNCENGVYFGITQLDGRVYRVILNIGSHPTVPEGEPTVEVHLLDFDGDLYGRVLAVRPLRFIRSERRFDSIEKLRLQLESDRQTARRLPLH